MDIPTSRFEGHHNVAKQDLKQGCDTRKPHGLLGRLAANERGNALMIAAASMIPLTAAIGAGVDMSRAYATHTRMQQACDAGVLAVRRNISGNTIDTASRTLGQQFFNVNFPDKTFNTTMNTAFTTSVDNTTNIVAGTATATLPYAMMPVIGFTNQQVTVSCQASQDFVNTDVVLVLDNTGSMNCTPSDGPNVSCSAGDPNSKIQGQRDAVMALYDSLRAAQTQLEGKGLRLRYGIVPYSSNVNVGKLLYGTSNGLNAIRAVSNYQQCTSRDRSGNCTAAKPVSTTHNKAWLDNWASISNPALGCIEERSTVNTITASTTTIPTNAWDLDLDRMPINSDVLTQWAPYDTTAETAKQYIACPSPAAALQAFDRATLLAYVKNLSASGGTYSDIGMIWGGRFISDSGVFAASPTSYNSFPVKKYVILITDGYIQTSSTQYSAWGVEKFDHLISNNSYPGDATDTANHKQRFSLACGAVKSKGASIWVVGFGASVGGSLDSTLTNCASSSEQAALAADSAALIAKFSQIGQSIGSLRVVK
jgi:Flp pilus assembly protein TadG